MKTGLKTIGNATIIAYDHNKPIIVTDPWLNNHSAYFGSWTLPYKIPEDILKDILFAEFIWFSHGHPDHLNPDSILEFKGKTILLADHVGSRIKEKKNMNKKDVLDKIKKDTGCDDDRAEEIFQRALQHGVVKVQLNWNFIITLTIYLTVLGTGVWAVCQYL